LPVSPSDARPEADELAGGCSGSPNSPLTLLEQLQHEFKLVVEWQTVYRARHDRLIPDHLLQGTTAGQRDAAFRDPT
jgi:hypothetical protein